VKTGKDANREGLYISECCKCKKVVRVGDMLPRCPKCLALTLWEFAGEDILKVA